MTNPRGAGFAVVTILALVAGAVAVAAVAAVQPASDAASSGPAAVAGAAASPSRAPDLTTSPAQSDSGRPATPPADIVAAEAPIGSDWCPAGSLSIVIEGADAATGHREAVLRATNVGSSPCVLDGYPDVAVADVHGGEVPLEIVHGSSFMATDPEPSAVIISPGGGAACVLGWDATDGRTAIGAVHVAAYAGVPRIALVASWDMTSHTRIAATAWQHD